jgi:hypothetical protein
VLLATINRAAGSIVLGTLKLDHNGRKCLPMRCPPAVHSMWVIYVFENVDMAFNGCVHARPMMLKSRAVDGYESIFWRKTRKQWIAKTENIAEII